MYEFDRILQELGEFGRYQKFVFCLLCIFSFLDVFTCFALVFIAFTPEHSCKFPQKFQNEKNFTNFSIGECEILKLDENSQNSQNSLECSEGWEYSQNYFQSTIVTEWNLVCERSILPKLMLSVFGIVIVIGCLILSQIQDKFGRKPAFFICLTFYLAGNILSQFTVKI